MRIVITGASGFLGTQLVPLLLRRVGSIVLVGRDPASVRKVFPGAHVIAYDDIEVAAVGYDILLHLAVMNNNQAGSSAAYERANVDLALETCTRARDAGIGRFVYVSSTQGLDERNASPYAASKRLAVQKLQTVSGIEVIVIYLPAIVGDRLSGKLAVLNKLPTALRRPVLSMLGSLRPTVHVDTIARALLSGHYASNDAGSPRIISDGQSNNRTFRIVKRLLDLAFAISIIVLLWWAMIIVWVVVRTQSPGPGIFRQARVGRNERVFTCYKFRSMYISAPNTGTHEVPAAAVTPIGRFLRRTKLDELPQVVNILANQMSLVGPRPGLPSQTELSAERRRLGVFATKPGITGLAQVNAVDMSDPTRLALLDRHYIRLQSLLLDLKIILATARGGGSGDNTKTD